jgi:hypothetical protein
MLTLNTAMTYGFNGQNLTQKTIAKSMFFMYILTITIL